MRVWCLLTALTGPVEHQSSRERLPRHHRSVPIVVGQHPLQLAVVVFQHDVPAQALEQPAPAAVHSLTPLCRGFQGLSGRIAHEPTRLVLKGAGEGEGEGVEVACRCSLTEPSAATLGSNRTCNHAQGQGEGEGEGQG